MSAAPVLKLHAGERIEPDMLVRLTRKGSRFAKQLAGKTEKVQVRMVQERYGEVIRKLRQAEREEADRRKRVILDMLRTVGEEDSDGRFILLEKICEALDVTAMQAMLLIHELNGNVLDPLNDGDLFIHPFFNHGSGELWLELWEPDGAERVK